MQISIVQIGNSKGIRLKKKLLKKYKINHKVELVLQDDCIIIKPIKKPRQGWAKAFKRMRENGDDELLIADLFEDEELEEWD
jgi:antitoxin MazE